MASDKKEFFVSLDLKNNSVLNFVADPVEAAPSSGAKQGQLKTYAGKLYVGQPDGSYKELGAAGDASQIASDLAALSTKVDGIKTTADKAATDITALTTRVDTAEGEIDTLQSGLATAEGNITSLTSRMTAAEGEIDALQLTVGDENSGLVKQVAQNKADIATKAAADDVYTKTEINGKVDTINASIATKANSADVYTKTVIDQTFGNYYLKTETYSATEIDGKITAASTKAYKVKGSVDTYDDLPKANQVVGDVYNVLATFTIDSKPYPAGTNVVWDGTAWDPLGGIVDLSPYALASTVSTLDTTLRGLISQKVAQSDYNAKVADLEAAIATKATTEALNTGLAAKVDKSTYNTDKSDLETAIGTKVTANSAITAGTYPKITFDAKGLVTGGESLAASDIPTITASKISDFAATARNAVRYQTTSASGAIVNVAHNLNVQFPHVSVYNSGGEEIGVHVKVTDSNNIVVSGNEDLGAITIVVSA